MDIGLVLVNQFSKSQNEAQIDDIASRLSPVIVPLFEYNEQGQQIPVIEPTTGAQLTNFSHYEFNGLAISHKVKIYQIIPFNPAIAFSFSKRQRRIRGVLTEEDTNNYEKQLRTGGFLPSNLYLLNSHKVFYCPSIDLRTDGRLFTNNHPRFFNWGLKRSTDYGAHATMFIKNYQTFDTTDLEFYLNELEDPDSKIEFVEKPSYNLASLRSLKEVGQLDESIPLPQAFSGYKNRIIQRGYLWQD